MKGLDQGQIIYIQLQYIHNDMIDIWPVSEYKFHPNQPNRLGRIQYRCLKSVCLFHQLYYILTANGTDCEELIDSFVPCREVM